MCICLNKCSWSNEWQILSPFEALLWRQQPQTKPADGHEDDWNKNVNEPKHYNNPQVRSNCLTKSKTNHQRQQHHRQYIMGHVTENLTHGPPCHLCTILLACTPDAHATRSPVQLHWSSRSIHICLIDWWYPGPLRGLWRSFFHHRITVDSRLVWRWNLFILCLGRLRSQSSTWL